MAILTFFTIVFALIHLQRLRSPFGLIVTWDGKRSAQIALSPNYWNNTCGLCGTFDDNPSNDFLIPDGTVVSAVLNVILYTIKIC